MAISPVTDPLSELRAAVLDAPGRPLRAADVPEPSPGPGRLLLRVHACGVCRTDLHIRDGEVEPSHLPLILGLPEELPCLRFDGRARFGTAHWKVEAIDEYAGARPLAWIDDSLDKSCRAWAASRRAPTLLVPTESHLGITDAHTEALLSWARDGYTAA